jgi:hypothetical protein
LAIHQETWSAGSLKFQCGFLHHQSCVLDDAELSWSDPPKKNQSNCMT